MTKTELAINDEVRQAWMQVCLAKTKYSNSVNRQTPKFNRAQLHVEVSTAKDIFEEAARKYFGRGIWLSWDNDSDCDVYDITELHKGDFKSVKHVRRSKIIFSFYYDNPLVLT